MEASLNEEYFVKLEFVIEETLKNSGNPDIFYLCKIYKYWDLVVGERLALRTMPSKLEKGFLSVLVKNIFD